MHTIKFTILTILSVQFSGIKYINIVVQPSPPSIYSSFLSYKTNSMPIKW